MDTASPFRMNSQTVYGHRGSGFSQDLNLFSYWQRKGNNNGQKKNKQKKPKKTPTTEQWPFSIVFDHQNLSGNQKWCFFFYKNTPFVLFLLETCTTICLEVTNIWMCLKNTLVNCLEFSRKWRFPLYLTIWTERQVQSKYIFQKYFELFFRWVVARYSSSFCLEMALIQSCWHDSKLLCRKCRVFYDTQFWQVRCKFS